MGSDRIDAGGVIHGLLVDARQQGKLERRRCSAHLLTDLYSTPSVSKYLHLLTFVVHF
jgi:hypothetical protein